MCIKLLHNKNENTLGVKQKNISISLDDHSDQNWSLDGAI